MLDGKTGELIPTSTFLVRINHLPDLHANWVQLNEDSTGKLTLPPEATLLTIQATFENATIYYVNCDSADQKPLPVDRWYAVADILASGVVARNGCVTKPKEIAKLKRTAKPGEFIFYVRKPNWREQSRDF